MPFFFYRGDGKWPPIWQIFSFCLHFDNKQNFGCLLWTSNSEKIIWISGWPFRYTWLNGLNLEFKSEHATDLAHAFYFLSLWLWIKLFSWIGEIFSLHLCQFFFFLFWPVSVSCQKWKKCQKVPRLLWFRVPNHPCFWFFQSSCNFLSCFCTLWNGENNNCLPLEAVVPKNNVQNGFRSTECQENLLLVLFFFCSWVLIQFSGSREL